MKEAIRSEGDAEIRPVLVGRHRPPGGPSRDPADHAIGFATALQNALDGAKELLYSEEDLGDEGTTFDVAIRFEATVTVRNPGAIGEYRASVTGS
jgi:hypothetical protein